MLRSAVEQYRTQQRLTVAAVLAARKAQAKGAAQIARVIAGFQLLAAQQATRAVPAMLAEQGVTAPPSGTLAATSLAGIASNGLPLTPLIDSIQAGYALDRFVATQVQDAGRVAASVEITARPEVEGYVRMLNPPSCSRCVILAGRWYRWNTGFERHPQCDCIHVPAAEATAHDLTVNPSDYFHSLSEAEQDKTFTKAGAQAIRDGADMGQVVNARRGMQTAQIGGRQVLTSTEGTTRRGLAHRGRTGRNMSQRLMPESIYAVATDRDDAIRLLKLHGFIL